MGVCHDVGGPFPASGGVNAHGGGEADSSSLLCHTVMQDALGTHLKNNLRSESGTPQSS